MTSPKPAPRMTAGDVLGALDNARGGGWLRVHGQGLDVRVSGSSLEILEAGRVVWSGRLIAYPAADRIEAGEALKTFPCCGCGAPVNASFLRDRPRADCPECGLSLVLAKGGPFRRWEPDHRRMSARLGLQLDRTPDPETR